MRQPQYADLFLYRRGVRNRYSPPGLTKTLRVTVKPGAPLNFPAPCSIFYNGNKIVDFPQLCTSPFMPASSPNARLLQGGVLAVIYESRCVSVRAGTPGGEGNSGASRSRSAARITPNPARLGSLFDFKCLLE